MITNSTLWIILVVALGLPSSVLGFLIRRIEKKFDKNEEAQKEKDKMRMEHEIMMIEISMAALSLAEATAEAVQRIPDANCNGEMHQALSEAKNIKEKYQSFTREQTVRNIMN